jgi:DNA polymerase III subunit beta
MKALIERKPLLGALVKIGGIIEARNIIPILSNVLIEAKDGSLTLMGTDLDLQIVETVSAQVESPGAISVEARTLLDIVRKLPEGSQVSLDLGDGRLKVAAARARFNLMTLPRDDFPVIAVGELPTAFPVPAKALRMMIDSVRHAISTEETRYYLNGIFLHIPGEDCAIRAAATDGHCLGRFDLGSFADAAGMPDIIVPRKCVGELRKLIDEIDGSIDVSLSASKIRFDLGGCVLTSKLIDGQFPDYTRVIPTGNDKRVVINPKSLFDAVDRVATIASEKTRIVKLAFGKDVLTLSCTSAAHGTACEEVPCDYAGEPIEIGFDSGYLRNTIEAIRADGLAGDAAHGIEILLADGLAPTLFRRSADAGAVFVVMPCRV